MKLVLVKGKAVEYHQKRDPGDKKMAELFRTIILMQEGRCKDIMMQAYGEAEIARRAF